MTVSRVGREHVFHIIEDNLSMLKEGKGSAVFVDGEFGYGKTMILRGVREIIDGESDIIAISVSGSGAHLREPYQPFKDAIAEFEKNLAKTIRGVGELLIPKDSPKHTSKFDRMQRKILDYAKLYSVLILADDIHEMDTGSVSLLYQLVRLSRKYPIMVLATYRGAESPPYLTEIIIRLQREGIATFLKLEPLSSQKTQEFVMSLGYSLPSNVLRYIYEQTEGIPYFIVELLHDMEERGIIDYKKKWSGALVEESALPAAVEGILLHRISNLTDVERTVLEYAAALGEEFDFDVLRAVSNMNDEALIEVLESLVRKRILKEEGTRYMFHHLMMRRVTYNDISKLRRMLMHRKIAHVLETMGGSVYEIAKHYCYGGNQKEALGYLLQAGEEAHREGTLRDALWYYQRALEIAKTLEQSEKVVMVHKEIGGIYLKLGDYRRAYIHLSEALKYGGDKAGLDILIDLAKCHLNLGEVDRAIEIYIKAAGTPELQSENIDIYTGMGDAYLVKGNYTEAMEYYRKALEIALESGNRERAVDIYNSIGTMYYSLLDYENAEKYFRRAYECVKDRCEHVGYIETLVNLASVLSEKNREKGIEYLKEALGIAERIGALEQMAKIYMNLSEALLREGEVEDSMHYLALAEEILESLGKLNVLRELYFQLSRIAIESGSLSLAMNNISRYIQVASYFGDRFSEGRGYLLKAYVYALSGKEEYIEMLDYGVELLSENPSTFGNMLIYFYRGNIALIRGQVEFAKSEFDRYMEHAIKLGRGFEMAWGLIRRGICNIVAGDFSGLRNDVKYAYKIPVHDFKVRLFLRALKAIADMGENGKGDVPESVIEEFRKTGLLYYYIESLTALGVARYHLSGDDTTLRQAISEAKKHGFHGYEDLYLRVTSEEWGGGEYGR